MIKGLSWKGGNRTALLVGSVAGVLCVLLAGIVAATIVLQRLDRVIVTRSQALVGIGQLRSEAQGLQELLRQAEQKLVQPSQGSLVTVVEGLATRIGGKGNLAYLRPLAAAVRDDLQMETLELKLERLTLEQLLRLCWEVENSPNAPMHIASLRLQRRFDNHALLDATITLNAFRK